MFVLRVLLLPYRDAFSVYFIQFRFCSRCKIFCILPIQTPPLSVFIFSGNQYRLKFCFKKFSTSLVFDDLQFFVLGPLLNLSIAIIIWYSPFNFLLFNLPEKSIWISCPGSVNVFRFPNSFFGNWFFKFLPDDMQATKCFVLSLISFCIIGFRCHFGSSGMSEM